MRGMICAVLLCALPQAACAQGETETEAEEGVLTSGTFSGLAFRSIGPAFMSGRISDIEVMQDDPSTWIVGVGSGGVWRTDNAGTTWTPIFDDQGVYSIGTVTVDPQNPHIIWVGTGENHGGRHVGYGNGVYRSRDGGQSWDHLGLEESEHISEILVHPEDSNTIWVASQGPLWSSGGDRGLFKSTDGGETWDLVLSAGEWTGVTDIVMDPRNPDRLVAATWQRHRTVAAYMGAGPESGLHVSDDGGETWREVTSGLPDGNMGKIGLAISPQNPDVLYAAIEQDRRSGGIYRSTNRGESWTRMSDTVSGGTGPHYYQELYAHPHHFDRIILVSNTTQISSDGGATFRDINNENKHVDDHAIAFHPTDPDFLLVGSDGGLYESLDGDATWRFISNLPITQFYDIALDDAEPFYNIYGGTQDNNSQMGPSRTDSRHGIRNSDWVVTLFGDGHEPDIEPGNPDIAYSSWQQGNVVRFDRTTGELVYVRAQPQPGEPAERFNWDAPLVVSSHEPARVYHASQRVWRSDDRGDNWTPISGDLTRNEDRMLLPIMGRQWSWEAGWDVYAMSNYNTISALAESPVDADVIYAGTDDGLIHVTTDGGDTWARTEAGSLRGVPDRAFINDFEPSRFEAGTVFMAMDNHKEGDFAPYLMRSDNHGRSWRMITNGLPENGPVWRIAQDHENPDLLFVGTDFGVFFTIDGGDRWTQLNAGIPPIPARDLHIHEREDDLVVGTFGRSIYILDDMSPFRQISEDMLETETRLFPVRRAWWYFEQHELGFNARGSQGHGYFQAENPPFGALITYYLHEGLQTSAEVRQDAESEANEAGEDTPFPGFDVVEAERREAPPRIWLVIRDSAGEVVRRLPGPVTEGFHRVAWDLTYPSRDAVTEPDTPDSETSGFLVAPGTYSVELVRQHNGETETIGEAQTIEVERLTEGALPGSPDDDVVAFWERLGTLQGQVSAANASIGQAHARLARLQSALYRSRTAPGDLDDRYEALRQELLAIEEALGGNQSRQGQYGSQPSTVSSRLSFAELGTGSSAYGPSGAHQAQLGMAEDEFAGLRDRLAELIEEDIPAFEADLAAAGAPWTPGRTIPPL
ncbi:VPS10 domain-containing protein [Hyphobacterium marinum]|uniref:Glycosyl hydrolase n=1 Tax=Hyphobacterium marinum TaxID=3116574 RepID=A0ABU7LVR7_9PROT|nr:glycosyl hydrolase [Hyphobacterium sp. Y6023]MEE2565656.1 glycosyl hydrolase [Hyphobacterium sp. Y6023]